MIPTSFKGYCSIKRNEVLCCEYIFDNECPRLCSYSKKILDDKDPEITKVEGQLHQFFYEDNPNNHNPNNPYSR